MVRGLTALAALLFAAIPAYAWQSGGAVQGFPGPGAIGSTSAPLPFVNVALTCTNSTSDAAANTTLITAAITAAGSTGASLVFPAGICWVNGPIVIPSNIWLIGQGKHTTIVKNNQTAMLFDFSGTSTSSRTSYSGAENIEFNGNAQTTDLVRAEWADHLNFNRVRFNNANGRGLYFIEVFDSYLSQCEFTFVGSASTGSVAAFVMQSDSTDRTNHIYGDDLRFESFPGDAMYIDNASSTHIPYALFFNRVKMESSAPTGTSTSGWLGGAIGAHFIDGTTVDSFHMRDLFLFAQLKNTGTAADLVNFVGRNSWQFQGVDVSGTTGAINSVFSVAPTGNNGHSIKGVTVNVASAGLNVSIINFPGSAPSDPTNPMRIENIATYGGETNTIYSGTIPQGVILADAPIVRSIAKSADFTFALSDAGGLDDVTAAAGVNATIPLNASVAFQLQTILSVCQLSTGAVTYLATGGVTLILANGSPTTAAQGACLPARKIGTDTWIIG